MSERAFSRFLRAEEELLAVVRRSPVAYLRPFLLVVTLSIAPFFFLVPLFRFGWAGIGGFVGVLILAAILAVRLWIVASRTVYLLTSLRIVDLDQRGFFERVVSEIRYADIVDASVRVKGFLATTTRTGDIVIETRSKRDNLLLQNVSNPEQLDSEIVHLRDRARTSADEAPGQPV